MPSSEWIFYGLTMGSAGCAALVLYPLLTRLGLHSAKRVERYQGVKVQRATKTLDDIFVDVKPRWLKVAYAVTPIVVGLVAYAFSGNVAVALVGTVAGIFLPDLWLRHRTAVRRRQFRNQLVDALMILSSGLRAGLSLTQSFEQLEAEMAPPASQEFGLMLKAHRLGRTLEESLQALNHRMPSEELELVITAVLVSRETGGDITQTLANLVSTIRERKKLQDKVHTLTLQGRLQAYILSALPVLFAMVVRSFNPTFFNVLLETEAGRMVLAIAIVLWVVGMVLLLRMSRVEI